MNTRQKAKYWKKRYKELIDSPVKRNILYAVSGTETLRCDRIISDEIYNMAYDNPELQRKIFGDVISELAEQAKPFVEISVEKDIFNCGVKISGRLNVAAPFRDNHDIYNTRRDVMHDMSPQEREKRMEELNDKQRSS